MKRHTLLGTLLGISLMAGSSLAHIEKSEPLQSLRQSYFALLGMTFAPMGDMVKCKIEWNDTLFMTWANDLTHAAQFGVERGFAPGTRSSPAGAAHAVSGRATAGLPPQGAARRPTTNSAASESRGRRR